MKRGISKSVSISKSLLTLAVLVNWLACTAHCQLANSGFVHETGCHLYASSEFDSESSEHDDSNVCDWMNSGALQAPGVRVVAPGALDGPVAPLLAADPCDDRLCSDSGGLTDWSVAPPELVHTLQFFFLTALPARAP